MAHPLIVDDEATIRFLLRTRLESAGHDVFEAQSGRAALDILVGIVGAFIGGFLFNQFGAAGVTGFNIWSVFVAFTGAVVLLAVIRLLSGRRRLVR